jgi:hypothetical protein
MREGNPRGGGGCWARGVPLTLDSARRRLRRARASARLVSARRRCSGESEETGEEAAGAVAARSRLAGRAKKSVMVLEAAGVGGDGAMALGKFGERRGVLLRGSAAEEMKLGASGVRREEEEEQRQLSSRAGFVLSIRLGPSTKRMEMIQFCRNKILCLRPTGCESGAAIRARKNELAGERTRESGLQLYHHLCLDLSA